MLIITHSSFWTVCPTNLQIKTPHILAKGLGAIPLTLCQIFLQLQVVFSYGDLWLTLQLASLGLMKCPHLVCFAPVVGFLCFSFVLLPSLGAIFFHSNLLFLLFYFLPCKYCYCWLVSPILHSALRYLLLGRIQIPSSDQQLILIFCHDHYTILWLGTALLRSQFSSVLCTAGIWCLKSPGNPWTD